MGIALGGDLPRKLGVEWLKEGTLVFIFDT